VLLHASSGSERQRWTIGLELTKLLDQLDPILVGQVDIDDR
jgi:hypothetical protein